MASNIVRLIGEEKAEELTRFIELHQLLTNGTGLDGDEYEEYENLKESLDDVLPL